MPNVEARDSLDLLGAHNLLSECDGWHYLPNGVCCHRLFRVAKKLGLAGRLASRQVTGEDQCPKYRQHPMA